MVPQLLGTGICGMSSSAEYVGWANEKFAKSFLQMGHHLKGYLEGYPMV
jgi:hypothetical protein